jgi:uncharacterized protein DUF1521
MTIHAARVDCCGNIGTGEYAITVGKNRHGTSFAEVRDKQGNFVERIYAGEREKLPDGTKIGFVSNKRGDEVTVTDKCGHTDKFNRPSEHDEWDRDHVRGGRARGHARHDCNDRDRPPIERHGGRTHGHDRNDRHDHVRGGRSHGHDRDGCDDWGRGNIHGGRPSLPTRPGEDDCGCNDGDSTFKVDEGNNAINTERFLITASGDREGELEVYDKKTGKYLALHGDPHGETGDKDKFDFSKRITVNLPDGAKLTIIPEDGENPHLKQAVITDSDGHAAVISYDEDHNPTTKELEGAAARSADWRTPDGTDLYPIDGNIENLRIGRWGPTIEGDEGNIDHKLALAQKRAFAPYRG